MSFSSKQIVGGVTGVALDESTAPRAVDQSQGGANWLGFYAKVIVAATFTLIAIGALVTTSHSGMAVPDWPLSFNSLNPTGWWGDWPVRLEHGHRLFAMFVGLLVGICTAWVWQSWSSLLAAAVVSGILPQLAGMFGASKLLKMHLGIWPAAVVFLVGVLLASRSQKLVRPRAVRYVSLIAFVLVCVQAVFGGLRVTQETGGALESAMAFRIAHGVMGQTFLCVNVLVATLLAASWYRPYGQATSAAAKSLSRLAWFIFGAVYLQLIVGAAMRHKGAGLAIPTFPQASPTGSWMPAVHNALVDLNFTHTRFGAVAITILIAVLARRALSVPGLDARLRRPAIGLLALVFVQFTLGAFVIWHMKPLSLTTAHVVNGAALLATSLLLAVRASQAARAASVGSASSLSS